MDHYNHHSSATFEGEYTRFSFPSGASLIIIICAVHTAKEKPVNVNVTYVPPEDGPIWQRDFWPEKLDVQASDSDRDFTLSAAFDDEAPANTNGVLARVNSKGGRFSLHTSSGFHFEATIYSHTPWSISNTSPEGPFINLPLPLHWHVLSAYSPCTANLQLPSEYAPTTNNSELGINTQCIAHLEKNWAKGFPAAHVWIQGHRIPKDTQSSAPSIPLQPSSQIQPHLLTLAGGPILGTEAYLVGYRNSTMNFSVDFRPPFTLSIAPMFWTFLDSLPGFISQAIDDYPLVDQWCQALLSPCTTAKRNWNQRTMNFTFCDPLLGWKLEVEASAMDEHGKAKAFYNLWAPYPTGFKKDWMAQCLRAKAYVRLWRRRWGLGNGLLPWRWELACEDWFDNVGFEFGGEYYPDRGVGEARVEA